jgi:glycosyltransferase involved in cell wall biosynthesis
VDTNIFYPEPQAVARTRLSLPPDRFTLVVSGRLNWVKGWRFALDVLDTLRRRTPGVHLIFVGDGEDRTKIQTHGARMGLGDHITITGFLPQDVVRSYLNAADVCLVASHSEGWSLSMLEILACGKPLVSTEVSGARAMICDGENGFVVTDRDPEQYAAAVRGAARLRTARSVSVQFAERYSVKHMADDLGRIWNPLAPTTASAQSTGRLIREAA